MRMCCTHSALYLTHSGDLKGKKVQKRGVTCVCAAVYSIVETNTAF